MTSQHAIDAHVHVWTSDVASYPLAAGYSAAQMQPSSITPEEFMTIARPLGVERAVLIQMDFYGFDNSYMLDTIKRFPGVFLGVAQVDPNSADPAAEMRRLKALGVRGVRIAPPRPGDRMWLDSRGMNALWQCGASDQMAICPLIDAEDLSAIESNCRRFPDTRVVIDHFAGIGSDGSFREADLRSLCGLAQHKQTFVKLSAFYFLGKKRPPYADLTPMIRRLLDAFGPERLMWGSDSPFQLQPPNTYQASLEFVRDQLDFINPGDKQWLLHQTAANVFF